MVEKNIGRNTLKTYTGEIKPAISPSTSPKIYSLTEAERIHLEIYGYVFIENVLDEKEINTILLFEEEYNLKKRPTQAHMFYTSVTKYFFSALTISLI